MGGFNPATGVVKRAKMCEHRRGAALIVKIPSNHASAFRAQLDEAVRNQKSAKDEYIGMTPILLAETLPPVESLSVVKVQDRRPYVATETGHQAPSEDRSSRGEDDSADRDDEALCKEGQSASSCWARKFLKTGDMQESPDRHVGMVLTSFLDGSPMAARWHNLARQAPDGKPLKGVTAAVKGLLRLGFHYIGPVLGRDMWARCSSNVVTLAGTQGKHAEFLVDVKADGDEKGALKLTFGDAAPITGLYWEYAAQAGRMEGSVCAKQRGKETDSTVLAESLGSGRRLLAVRHGEAFIPSKPDLVDDSNQLPLATNLRRSKVTVPGGAEEGSDKCLAGELYMEKTCGIQRKQDMELCKAPEAIDADDNEKHRSALKLEAPEPALRFGASANCFCRWDEGPTGIFFEGRCENGDFHSNSDADREVQGVASKRLYRVQAHPAVNDRVVAYKKPKGAIDDEGIFSSKEVLGKKLYPATLLAISDDGERMSVRFDDQGPKESKLIPSTWVHKMVDLDHNKVEDITKLAKVLPQARITDVNQPTVLLVDDPKQVVTLQAVCEDVGCVGEATYAVGHKRKNAETMQLGERSRAIQFRIDSAFGEGKGGPISLTHNQEVRFVHTGHLLYKGRDLLY